MFGLRQIGDNWNCLVLRNMAGGNNGVTEAGESWFSIEEYGINKLPTTHLKPLFSYQYYFSHENLEAEKTYEEKAEIKLVKRPESVWDLDVVLHRTGKDTVSHFVFDVGIQQYRPKDH